MGNTINWSIDPAHSTIGFKIKHMMISFVRGRFDKFNGTVTMSGDDLTTTKVDLSVETDSVNTEEPQRDKHLASADFFDSAVYPNLHFVSTKITKIDDENYTLDGDLTIRGVTKPITLKVVALGPIKDPFGNMRYGFTITGSLSRKVFGVSWNGPMPGGNTMIGDEVLVNCEVEIYHKIEA